MNLFIISLTGSILFWKIGSYYLWLSWLCLKCIGYDSTDIKGHLYLAFSWLQCRAVHQPVTVTNTKFYILNLNWCTWILMKRGLLFGPNVQSGLFKWKFLSIMSGCSSWVLLRLSWGHMISNITRRLMEAWRGHAAHAQCTLTPQVRLTGCCPWCWRVPAVRWDDAVVPLQTCRGRQSARRLLVPEQKELKHVSSSSCSSSSSEKHGDVSCCSPCVSPRGTHRHLPVDPTQARGQSAGEEMPRVHVHAEQWVHV